MELKQGRGLKKREETFHDQAKSALIMGGGDPFFQLVLIMVDAKDVEVTRPVYIFFVSDSDTIFVLGYEQDERRFRSDCVC